MAKVLRESFKWKVTSATFLCKLSSLYLSFSCRNLWLRLFFSQSFSNVDLLLISFPFLISSLLLFFVLFLQLLIKFMVFSHIHQNTLGTSRFRFILFPGVSERGEFWQILSAPCRCGWILCFCVSSGGPCSETVNPMSEDVAWCLEALWESIFLTSRHESTLQMGTERREHVKIASLEAPQNFKEKLHIREYSNFFPTDLAVAMEYLVLAGTSKSRCTEARGFSSHCWTKFRFGHWCRLWKFSLPLDCWAKLLWLWAWEWARCIRTVHAFV